MTQEQEELLLKDLCARLPYGVKIKIKTYEDIDEIDSIGTLCQLNKQYFWILEDEYERCIEYNKPYLFPLSSMTEEQQKEYRKICDLDMEILENRPMKGEPFPAMFNSQDWLDGHHFDYRGLIPMGLANDATGLNIY